MGCASARHPLAAKRSPVDMCINQLFYCLFFIFFYLPMDVLIRNWLRRNLQENLDVYSPVAYQQCIWTEIELFARSIDWVASSLSVRENAPGIDGLHISQHKSLVQFQFNQNGMDF